MSAQVDVAACSYLCFFARPEARLPRTPQRPPRTRLLYDAHAPETRCARRHAAERGACHFVVWGRMRSLTRALLLLHRSEHEPGEAILLANWHHYRAIEAGGDKARPQLSVSQKRRCTRQLSVRRLTICAANPHRRAPREMRCTTSFLSSASTFRTGFPTRASCRRAGRSQTPRRQQVSGLSRDVPLSLLQPPLFPTAPLHVLPFLACRGRLGSPSALQGKEVVKCETICIGPFPSFHPLPHPLRDKRRRRFRG